MERPIKSEAQHYIGIDVSKLTLDISIYRRSLFVAHYQICNEPEAIRNFIGEARATHAVVPRKTVFGMEQTGLYGKHLLDCLSRMDTRIVVEDPAHLKKSMGTVRGKTDKVDSKRIATYLFKNRDSLVFWNARRPILDELASLCTLRDRLISIEHALRTPLKESKKFIAESAAATLYNACMPTITALGSDLKKLENYTETLWKSDRQLNALMELITSVPGVGPITALRIVISTNEFLRINDPRKFACYCGVAPFPHNSGSSIRGSTRISPIANKKLKSLIHSCAVSAKRFVPEITAYYERKTAEGKHKMSVMNAIRFKIIARIFACVNQQRRYQSDYVPVRAGIATVVLDDLNSCSSFQQKPIAQKIRATSLQTIPAKRKLMNKSQLLQ